MPSFKLSPPHADPDRPPTRAASLIVQPTDAHAASSSLREHENELPVHHFHLQDFDTLLQLSHWELTRTLCVCARSAACPDSCLGLCLLGKHAAVREVSQTLWPLQKRERRPQTTVWRLQIRILVRWASATLGRLIPTFRDLMAVMTAVAASLARLGDEVQDVDEETFSVLSQSIPSQDLGMVDAKAETLEISVCGRDFEVTQSPGVLQSNRAGGTTGAAVWRTSVAFAEWLGSANNALFMENLLVRNSTTLELGAGISGILPCLLSSKVRQVMVTDQSYIIKLLRDNISANRASRMSRGKRSHGSRHQSTQLEVDNIRVFPLDWENDDIPSVMSVNNAENGVDAIFVCDCVFNYALIEPLVQTCAQICSLRNTRDPVLMQQPTVCVIAQQLRQPEVFEQWLTAFHQLFRIWRIRDEFLSSPMKEGSGYVIHIGILRGND